MSINNFGAPCLMPEGRSLVELAVEANRTTHGGAEGEARLAQFMGLVVMQPGHPARADVLAYLTRFGRGAMFGLIPVSASPTIH
jgi:hypothetical protein